MSRECVHVFSSLCVVPPIVPKAAGALKGLLSEQMDGTAPSLSSVYTSEFPWFLLRLTFLVAVQLRTENKGVCRRGAG